MNIHDFLIFFGHTVYKEKWGDASGESQDFQGSLLPASPSGNPSNAEVESQSLSVATRGALF
jgi:hypothetical protein